MFPDVNTDVFSGNTSSEDLEKFSERFIDQEGEEDATVTMTTTQGPTEKGGAKVNNAASLPVSLVRTCRYLS